MADTLASIGEAKPLFKINNMIFPTVLEQKLIFSENIRGQLHPLPPLRVRQWRRTQDIPVYFHLP